jgi:hypothetical protein
MLHFPSASWVQLRNYSRKRSGSSLENIEYGRGDPSRWPRGTLHPQKLSLTSSTCGGRTVGIVRSRTQAMEIFLLLHSKTLKNQTFFSKKKERTPTQNVYDCQCCGWTFPCARVTIPTRTSVLWSHSSQEEVDLLVNNDIVIWDLKVYMYCVTEKVFSHM